MEDGIYAKIKTEKGEILIFLEYKLTPITVANFVGLSGTLSNYSNKKNIKFYNNLVFHRVIPDFIFRGALTETAWEDLDIILKMNFTQI